MNLSMGSGVAFAAAWVGSCALSGLFAWLMFAGEAMANTEVTATDLLIIILFVLSPLMMAASATRKIFGQDKVGEPEGSPK